MNSVCVFKAATEKNEIDAVRCLCLAGLDLNITNKDGLTAEQLATTLKHVNIANLLSSLRRVSPFYFFFYFTRFNLSYVFV